MCGNLNKIEHIVVVVTVVEADVVVVVEVVGADKKYQTSYSH